MGGGVGRAWGCDECPWVCDVRTQLHALDALRASRQGCCAVHWGSWCTCASLPQPGPPRCSVPHVMHVHVYVCTLPEHAPTMPGPTLQHAAYSIALYMRRVPGSASHTSTLPGPSLQCAARQRHRRVCRGAGRRWGGRGDHGGWVCFMWLPLHTGCNV